MQRLKLILCSLLLLAIGMNWQPTDNFSTSAKDTRPRIGKLALDTTPVLPREVSTKSVSGQNDYHFTEKKNCCLKGMCKNCFNVSYLQDKGLTNIRHLNELAILVKPSRRGALRITEASLRIITPSRRSADGRSEIPEVEHFSTNIACTNCGENWGIFQRERGSSFQLTLDAEAAEAAQGHFVLGNRVLVSINAGDESPISVEIFNKRDLRPAAIVRPTPTPLRLPR